MTHQKIVNFHIWFDLIHLDANRKPNRYIKVMGLMQSAIIYVQFNHLNVIRTLYAEVLVQYIMSIMHFIRPFTLGVMLCVMQNCRCVRMLSMLWKGCWRVVLRYFCMARAMGAKMAWAASRGSITSLGCLGEDATSSSWRRLMWVKASSTATTNLGGETSSPLKLQTLSKMFMWVPVYLRIQNSRP